MGVQLRDYQLDAVRRMKDRCILCGDVGSGKSRTALAYYYLENGGAYSSLSGDTPYCPMEYDLADLYIITTARKRDTLEWNDELVHFLLYSEDEKSKFYSNKVVIDSWNNIAKYKDVEHSFFIFDEQRVIGKGAWVKNFLKIAERNRWILLSATPGDTWQDYIPVFIANGFFRNRTQFMREHAVITTRGGFPKIERYLGTKKLERLRDQILVNMAYKRQTVSHNVDIIVDYDIEKYKQTTKTRVNPYNGEPILNAAELCFIWRKIVNSDERRSAKLLNILDDHEKAIIFYNFNYELTILRSLAYIKGTKIAEWNGLKHEPIPKSKRWVYLVQYTAGSEGWNCTETDTVIFYSQNYSYRMTVQAAGRINRMNTPFENLYYYSLKSKSPIDLAIARALKNKKNFNESRFVKW